MSPGCRDPHSWKRIPQGHAGSPSSIVRIMLQAIAGLVSVRAYLNDAVVFDAAMTQHIQSIRAFLA